MTIARDMEDMVGKYYSREWFRSNILHQTEEEIEQEDKQIVKDYIRKIGEREIQAQVIGKQVMNQLKDLDQVAYVRFASVYQDFQDIKDFADEVSELSKN